MERLPDLYVVFVFNGSRKKPATDGYRPIHELGNGEYAIGIHHYANHSAMPGESVRGSITFLNPRAFPNSLWAGKRIRILEGEINVGYAQVLQVINPRLLREGKEKEDEKTE